ncbi:unnamed protein product [Boreogadus saida]
MHIVFLLLFFIIEHVSPKKVCCYQDVLDHLNISRKSERHSSTRPVKDHTRPTILYMDVYISAILSVNEKAQTFSPLVWLQMSWNDERISWDPAQFCGISRVSVPKEFLWKPDIFIFEMTQRDEALPNPYLLMTHEGRVHLEDDLKVVITCKMDVHKFPFDTQSCNITITSVVHRVNELRLFPSSNSSRVTQFSRQLMQTQGEWEFLTLAVTNNTLDMDGFWDQIVYTISMKRRPLLHVINFLLPVLFFLCLDLSSFLISDHRGDKLGFKVTVLLAISVLLLILNEILPSMSNRTPLIATYCIVIFAMMLLSLLETVLVTHLMEKDSRIMLEEAEQKWTRDSDSCQNTCKEENCTHDSSNCNGSGGGTSRELLPVADHQGARDPQRADPHLLLLILEELGEVRSLRRAGGPQGPGLKAGYWTRLARRTNVVFFTFYLTAVSLFLSFLFIEWSS